MTDGDASEPLRGGDGVTSARVPLRNAVTRPGGGPGVRTDGGRPTVAVVGGGVAGLVAARHLAAAGAEVVLFERRDAVGGRVRSAREEGFTLDRGFQVLFTAYPAAERELDLDALDLRRFAPGAVVCRGDRRSVLADPLRNPRAAFESLTSPEAALGDAFRVLRLRRELRAKSVEEIRATPATTTAAYLDRRGFSRRFVEGFFAPFYGGITLDRTLSASSRVFEFTFKMLAEGYAAVPARGMGAVAEQLAASARAAGARVETGREVTAVGADAAGATVTLAGETVDVDAAVVATDPPTARELTGVGTIPTEPRGCVTQYYRLPGEYDLRSGGRLLLNADDPEPNEVVPLSAIAPEYAPEDRTLIAAVFLGDREEGERELADLTGETLESWYPALRVSDLDLLRTARTPFAQFAQPPGIDERLPDVRAPPGRRYLAGEYTRGSSLNGAMESGRDAALAIAADLDALDG